MSSQVGFNCLPTPLNYQILNLLENKDLQAFSRVSKNFNNLAKSTICSIKINNYIKYFRKNCIMSIEDIDILKEKNFESKKEKFINELGWQNVYLIREIMKTEDPFFDECLKIHTSRTGFSLDYLRNIPDRDANLALLQLNRTPLQHR